MWIRSDLSMEDLLDQSVQYLKGVGPKRAALLAKLGVHTVRDVLYYAPRDYQDRTQLLSIKDIEVGTVATVVGEVLKCGSRKTRGGMHLTELFIGDETGVITATWFTRRYPMKHVAKVGDRVLASGKVNFYDGLQLVSPDLEVLAAEDVADDCQAAPAGAILPVYPATEGLPQFALRKLTASALDTSLEHEEETLPRSLLDKRDLLPVQEALRHAHYPDSMTSASAARRRLAYDEFLALELAMAMRRRGIKDDQHGLSFKIGQNVDTHIRRLFPFQLTGAQDRSINEIAEDMRSPKPMNRLLQGDVGSGKTVVAVYAMLSAIANGHQAALMAPTEILAEQHFVTLQEFLASAHVEVGLFTGGVTGKERREKLEALASGDIQLAVGTHALIQKSIEFHRLGLVVVDEQHKFGVMQRAELRHKGVTPDVLVMTATPIPRTLSLTVFGDLDVSTIDEMPPGRQPIETHFVYPDKREQALNFVRQQLAAGRQAFVVYPLVEESEHLDLQAATEAADQIRNEVLPNFRIGLIHGRMKAAEKDEIMRAFRAGSFDVLVATTVIEVGIDVPNATIMVIEHANRYGLAQLHQLRGRIGRGEHESHCFLFGYPGTDDAKERLKVMTDTTDGFRIAEVDLKLRGPGEFFGTKQHGLPDLRFGDIIEDFKLLRAARQDAFELIASDPSLSDPDRAPLRRSFRRRFEGRLDLIEVG